MSVPEFFKGKDLSLISIACIPGGGKTTFRELLVALLVYLHIMRDRVHSVDMSDLLDQNAAGRSQGAMVTNDIVTTAIMGHFSKTLTAKPQTNTIVWSGWPRDPRQGKESTSFARRGILHIDTPPHVARRRYLDRWLRTPPEKRRPDDPKTLEEAETMFEKRKAVFEQTVLPMLDEHRDRVVVIDRSAPLLMQLCDAIRGLSELRDPPIDPGLAARIISAVQSDIHPIHDMIAEIESPQPSPYRGPLRSPEDRFWPIGMPDRAHA
jgi:adenylate kinase family enzyme